MLPCSVDNCGSQQWIIYCMKNRKRASSLQTQWNGLWPELMHLCCVHVLNYCIIPYKNAQQLHVNETLKKNLTRDFASQGNDAILWKSWDLKPMGGGVEHGLTFEKDSVVSPEGTQRLGSRHCPAEGMGSRTEWGLQAGGFLFWGLPLGLGERTSPTMRLPFFLWDPRTHCGGNSWVLFSGCRFSRRLLRGEKMASWGCLPQSPLL